ncbi:hypothetical protein ERO13_D13G212550v2 [Gossypium hirsutum]|uniref:Uncharacterized protein n=1 Tax=Gossypium raimondii TaxID=29730 RepID=A0A0D2VJM4_GOSRA|nr:hypothetical protein ERO13_D13G212550v2 [Gossypium hirsutum]KJB83354.1 hypothetical protein B456_013G242900 [Gossypium raimondii]
METRKHLQQHSHRRKKATTMTLGWPWIPSPPNRLRQTNYYAANESNRKKKARGGETKKAFRLALSCCRWSKNQHIRLTKAKESARLKKRPNAVLKKYGLQLQQKFKIF